MIRTTRFSSFHCIHLILTRYIMPHYRCFACVFITILIGGVSVIVASTHGENISDPAKRFTHAIINGQVRGEGALPLDDRSSYLLVELRLSRDDRPRPIARTKLKLKHNGTTDLFLLPFKLKYALDKINPHNTYILSARIRDGQNKTLYVGDLPVPVTERKEKQAKHLVIPMVETRECQWRERVSSEVFAISIMVQ